ncbi:MAG: hypothetical protein KDD56_07815 [Bdellovibrionales bacterium]|nr:hypothetical protein [Bdellovibrionales bacterium]
MPNQPKISPEQLAANRKALLEKLEKRLPDASEQAPDLSNTSLSQATLRLKSILGNNYFGAEDYQAIFRRDVDKVPRVPASVTPELLNSKCPMAGDGRLIKDTHRLVLVPRLLGTDEFTIMWLEEHADKYSAENSMPQAFKSNVTWFHEKKENFAHMPTGKTHWALLPMLPVPDTFEKDDKQQLKIMKAFPDYETPHAIEMLAGIVLPYLRDARGIENYDYPFRDKHGRCEDRTSDGSCVDVGGFDPSGIGVSSRWHKKQYIFLGRCSARKL